MANENTYDLLIRYYEVHVAHRRYMLHFLLIASGIALTGIAATVKEQGIFAIILTALALLITIGFRALDAISYNKITHCEELLKNEKTINKTTAKNLLNREKLDIKMGDNQVTKVLMYIIFGFFYLVLIGLFAEILNLKTFQTSELSLGELITLFLILIGAASTESTLHNKKK